MNCKEISAIVLAAGESSRLGKPKQLIPWQGKTLLGYTIQKIRKSGIEDIVLVLGAYSQVITNTINIIGLRIVNNPLWKTGKASSIKAGLSCISTESKGVIIFLSDQPFLSTRLITELINASSNPEAEIIAPQIGNRLANPVLFKKEVFHAFETLMGEEGGKNLFDKFNMYRIPWKDARILKDIDTMDDLSNLV